MGWRERDGEKSKEGKGGDGERMDREGVREEIGRK